MRVALLVRLHIEKIEIPFKRKILMQLLQAIFLFGAVNAVTYKAGQKVSVRAIKPTSQLCPDSSTIGKRYCNGDPNNVCDAKGFVVSKVKKGKKIGFLSIHNCFSNVLELEKASRCVESVEVIIC